VRQTDRQAHANKCLIKQSELAPGAYRKTDRHGRVDEEEPLQKKKKKKKNMSKREREKREKVATAHNSCVYVCFISFIHTHTPL